VWRRSIGHTLNQLSLSYETMDVSTDAPGRRYGATVTAVAMVAVTVAVVVTVQWLLDTPSQSEAAPAAGSTLPGSPGATPPVGAAPSVSLSPTDIAFIELMIPMNERALPLLDLLVDGSVAADLRDAAVMLLRSYPDETAQLRAALEAGGVAEQGLHAGMDMPGYVTVDQLARVEAGSDRDTVAREVLCWHLNQSLRVAQAEVDNGSDPAVRTVAQSMVELRATTVAALRCRQGG
jgi:uncharacterized protein (DUF305 family)